jgi:hypothetical protein
MYSFIREVDFSFLLFLLSATYVFVQSFSLPLSVFLIYGIPGTSTQLQVQKTVQDPVSNVIIRCVNSEHLLTLLKAKPSVRSVQLC